MKNMSKNVKIFIGVLLGLLILGCLSYVIVDHFKNSQNKSASSSNVNKLADVDSPDGEAYNYEEGGYLKLGTYKEVVVDVAASDDDVEYAIDDFCTKYGDKKEATVVSGDAVTVDFTGTIEGEKSENLSEEDASLVLGEYEYLEEFENGIMGHKVGETVKVPVEFPEDYGDEEVDGKTVEFTIKIKAKKAEFTDETVTRATKGKYTTVKEYKEKIKKDIEKENIDALGDSAWEQIKEETELVEVPNSLKTLCETDTNKMYQNFAELQGITVEETLASFGMSMEDIPEMVNDLAKDRMIAKTIAKRENLSMPEDYYKKALITQVEGDEESTDGKELEDGEYELSALEASYKESMGSRPKDDMLVIYVKDFVEKQAKPAK